MIVRIDFHLDEEVTPRIFLQRVSDACHQFYALRENEFVTLTGAHGEVLPPDTAPSVTNYNALAAYFGRVS